VIVEYASVIAAMSVLVSTITGTFGQRLAALPTTQANAVAAVTAGARSQKVSSAQARSVYKHAPYSKPVLKYLYTVGWIGGKKSAVSCLFARTMRSDTEKEALTEIRKNAKLVHQLRRAHVGLKLAATVLVRGIASACTS
jgi:hypothetical protein